MSVILLPGKEKSVLRRHPWIFSGAIQARPEAAPGEILPIYSAAGDFLARGYFHPSNSIAGRILSFTDVPIETVLRTKLEDACKLRARFMPANITNGYRLVNAEGDGLPGLVVDYYAGVLVVQINTWGMERLQPRIVDLLLELIAPRSIYEKSLSAARRQEGLEDRQGLVWGELIEQVEIVENGLKFLVSITAGQKTGFFLDQREMRRAIGNLSHGKRVLNCFAYTGGFSLFALQGGARQVDSVDSCKSATALAAVNTRLNGFDPAAHNIFTEDVFKFLRRPKLDYDLVILDPPAFAKKRADIAQACQGYKEINRLVLDKIPAQSILCTSSCSHYIDEDLFQNLIFQAALEAGRSVKIVGRHLQAADHPLSVYHPEGTYLKSLILFVD